LFSFSIPMEPMMLPPDMRMTSMTTRGIRNDWEERTPETVDGEMSSMVICLK